MKVANPKRQTTSKSQAPAFVSHRSAESISERTVGERLVRCREERGLKQAEAARRIKISAQSLGELERGKSRQPAADTLLNMRDALGFSPDYIIRGKGMPLLPNFEEMAKEQALIAIFRDLKPENKDAAVKIVQSLRRAQGGRSQNDPFAEDPPDG